tara:strand:- start:585 stop:920 length:336 start_codon:yes stop_codon:yes gene_type:complete
VWLHGRGQNAPVQPTIIINLTQHGVRHRASCDVKSFQFQRRHRVKNAGSEFAERNEVYALQIPQRAQHATNSGRCDAQRGLSAQGLKVKFSDGKNGLWKMHSRANLAVLRK